MEPRLVDLRALHCRALGSGRAGTARSAGSSATISASCTPWRRSAPPSRTSRRRPFCLSPTRAHWYVSGNFATLPLRPSAVVSAAGAGVGRVVRPHWPAACNAHPSYGTALRPYIIARAIRPFVPAAGAVVRRVARVRALRLAVHGQPVPDHDVPPPPLHRARQPVPRPAASRPVRRAAVPRGGARRCSGQTT